MEKYRYLCFYANLSLKSSLSASLDQIQKIGKIDSILFTYSSIYLKLIKSFLGIKYTFSIV